MNRRGGQNRSSLYLRSDSQGSRSFGPQSKRIEEKNKTGRLCIHVFDSQGYRSLDPQPKRIEEKNKTGRLCIHVFDSQGYRSLDPQPKRIEKEDRSGRLCTAGDPLRALGLETLSQRESKRSTG